MRRTHGGLRLSLAVFAAVAGACTSGASGSPTTTTAPPPPVTIARFDVTGMEVHGAPRFPEEARAAVTSVLDRYLEVALVAPLRSGQSPAPGSLEALFTAAASSRLASPDRESLVEEPVAAPGRRPAPAVRRDRAQAYLAGLAGPDGHLAVVTASVDIVIRAGTAVVSRVGELVLSPDSTGQWRIDGYALEVRRGTA